MKIRHADGTVHFSQLKSMARSPAHYKCACEREFKPSRPMRIGTIAHRIILGARPGHGLAVWDGERRGKLWTEFQTANTGIEIVTMNEAIEAQAIADAALADPLLAELLEGAQTEVPLTWIDAGIECSTEGVDILRPDVLADLKTTSTTEPGRWSAHAVSLAYHAQLAWYDTGARANGYAPTRRSLVGIEATPPHAVTILDVTPAMLAQGKKAICLWLERLRSCEENDDWPAYTRSPIPLDVPAWMGPEEEGDEEGDEAA